MIKTLQLKKIQRILHVHPTIYNFLPYFSFTRYTFQKNRIIFPSRILSLPPIFPQKHRRFAIMEKKNLNKWNRVTKQLLIIPAFGNESKVKKITLRNILYIWPIF